MFSQRNPSSSLNPSPHLRCNIAHVRMKTPRSNTIFLMYPCIYIYIAKTYTFAHLNPIVSSEITDFFCSENVVPSTLTVENPYFPSSCYCSGEITQLSPAHLVLSSASSVSMRPGSAVWSTFRNAPVSSGGFGELLQLGLYHNMMRIYSE